MAGCAAQLKNRKSVFQIQQSGAGKRLCCAQMRLPAVGKRGFSARGRGEIRREAVILQILLYFYVGKA
jgi:hypothetical protein